MCGYDKKPSNQIQLLQYRIFIHFKIQDLFISRIKAMTTDCEFDINLGISAIYDHQKPKSLSRKLKIELKSKPLMWCGVVWSLFSLFGFVSFHFH